MNTEGMNTRQEQHANALALHSGASSLSLPLSFVSSHLHFVRIEELPLRGFVGVVRPLATGDKHEVKFTHPVGVFGDDVPFLPPPRHGVLEYRWSGVREAKSIKHRFSESIK